MKIYIVTESNRNDNLLLRSWVCFSREEAMTCLKNRYDIACTYNRIGGLDDPTDTLEYGFFFWNLENGTEMKYCIIESKTYAE